MAFCAAQARMFSTQRETGYGVIETCTIPPLGRVTGTAVGAELPVVVIIGGVTGVTICGCALVSIGMT